MHITSTLNLIEAWWVLGSFIGLGYGLYLYYEARKDVLARQLLGINHGTQDVARLVVVTSILASFALFTFLVAGLLAASIPTSRRITPMSYFIQALLVLGHDAIVVSLWYQERVRRRVLRRDMQNATVRQQAEETAAAQQAKELAERSNESRDRLTTATEGLTHATEAATIAMQNGPLVATLAATIAQVDLTRATDDNTAATEIDTAARLKEGDAGE